MTEQHHFDANKIFYALFVLTAVEVAWGVLFPYEWKFVLWSGLLICAYLKGLLIFMYFMHMKFERKSLFWTPQEYPDGEQ